MADKDPRKEGRQSGKRRAASGGKTGRSGGSARKAKGADAESRQSGVVKKGRRASANTGSQPAVNPATAKHPTGSQKPVKAAASKRTTGLQTAVKAGKGGKGGRGTTGVQKAVTGKDETGTQHSARSRKGGKRGARASKSDRAHAHGKHAGRGMRKRGLGLAAKFSIPVCILIAAVIAIWGFWVSQNMRQTLMNDIKKNGVTGLNFLSRVGEQILATRDRRPATWPLVMGFLAPEDIEAELGKNIENAKTRLPRLVEEAFPTPVKEERMDALQAALEKALDRPPAELLHLYDDFFSSSGAPSGGERDEDGAGGTEDSTGAEAAAGLDEDLRKRFRTVLQEILRNTVHNVGAVAAQQAILHDVLVVELEGKGEVETELLDAFLYDAQGRPIAGARPIAEKREISYDPRDRVKRISIGEAEGDLARITMYRGLVKEGGRRYPCMNFEKDIQADIGGRTVGAKAVLALSARRIDEQLAALRTVMIAIGVVAVVLGAGLCFLVAWFVTKPVHILIRDMEVVAQGDLEHQTRAHSSDEIGAVATQFNEMTQRLLVAHEAEKENQRYEDELEMAREIQQKLLPPKIPKIRGLDIHATYHPAKEVGGDYYDLFPIDKEHLGVIAADVSGKGIPGSMVMATTRTVLRFVAARNTSAANTLLRTNQVVAADIRRGMFVTAFYIVLNVRTHEMVVASAGHNPMAVYRAATGEVEKVNPGGIALGFDKGPLFERTIKEEKLSLSAGDRVVLYTDGVVEAMNERNEEYTDDRFYDFVRDRNDLGSEAFVDALLADLEAHKGKAEQHDDITIVTFRQA